MRNLDPKIELQQVLSDQIYKALQGDVIGSIRLKVAGDQDICLHSDMKGHSLPVKENILPDLYKLCHEVMDELEFAEPIDFYITGRSEVNACAIGSNNPDTPHIIEINSALFDLMSEQEMRYIIGHEIGHLINRDSLIRSLYHYVYPDPEAAEAAPEFLKARYELWGRMAELSADRYGFIGCGDLEACITAIFKLASGLHLDKMNIRFDDMMALNRKHLDFFLNESLSFGGTHPVNPIRIQALHLFARAKTQKALNEGMWELLNVLECFFMRPWSEAFAVFRAAAGLYMCRDASGKLDRREEDFILNAVAKTDLFPSRLLKRIAKADYLDIMKKSMADIVEQCPPLRQDIIIYLIDLAFIDTVVEVDEVKRIVELGEELGYDADEISRALTSKIRVDLTPQASFMK